MNKDSISSAFIVCWLTLLIWGIISLFASASKSLNNCGKSYPIDYVLYTNLFCEIKPPPEEKGDNQ